MDDPQAWATSYFAARHDPVWRWADDGDVVVWNDGTTVAFRQELIHILEWLLPHGWPPFGALIWMLAACRGKLPPRAVQRSIASHEIAAASDGLSQMDLFRDHVRKMHATVEDGLAAIADLPAETRSSWKAKATLAEMIFGKLVGKAERPKLLEAVVEVLRSGVLTDGAGDPWSPQTPAGTMLAVYTLLEDHLGVHWFWPGEFGEHVPHDPDAIIPALDVRATPPFEIRSVELGYFSCHTKAFLESARKWARRNRLGWVRSAVFGHSWEAAFDLRKGETYHERPEWFAPVNGQRKPPQMCTTNPEVIARMVDYVLHGREDIMNISPSDGGGFCECDCCRALDVPGVLDYDHRAPQLSDRIFTYANEVARRVREQKPNKGCGMFAYTFYNKPPVRLTHLEPNLYLSFVFQSAAHRNPDNLREWHESVAGWQKLGAEMVVREGWGNHYYFDLPFVHYDQIIASLAESARLGFIAAYGEGSKCFATQAPNDWAITHMMWNPRRDPTQVMPEFFASAYGPAAPEMQAFFETYNRALNANWSKLSANIDTTQIAYGNILPAWHRLLPPETLDEAERHLDAVSKLAPEGEYAGRVAFHRFGQRYTRVMLELLETYRLLGVIVSKADGAPSTAAKDSPGRAGLLRRTYELGEEREKLLLAHRDWAGPDEGLYAFTNDAKIRQWHAEVKKELGIDQPSALTKAGLSRK